MWALRNIGPRQFRMLKIKSVEFFSSQMTSEILSRKLWRTLCYVFISLSPGFSSQSAHVGVFTHFALCLGVRAMLNMTQHCHPGNYSPHLYRCCQPIRYFPLSEFGFLSALFPYSGLGPSCWECKMHNCKLRKQKFLGSGPSPLRKTYLALVLTGYCAKIVRTFIL